MIECSPKSLFSGNFIAHGLSSGRASIEYDWLSEQGQIVTEEVRYEIRKHGVLSGRWTLEEDGDVIADARKPSAMFRCFEITGHQVEFTLKAASPFTRAFEIVAADELAGNIRPAHAFTRRALIDCSDAIPGYTQLFAFWLVALTWRRSARSNSGGA